MCPSPRSLRSHHSPFSPHPLVSSTAPPLCSARIHSCSPSPAFLRPSLRCLVSCSAAAYVVRGAYLDTRPIRSRSVMATATDSTSSGRHQRRLGHAAGMSRAFLCVFVGLLCLGVASSAAYNASQYPINDFVLGYVMTGPKLIMIVNSTPANFMPSKFLRSSYEILSQFDTAIANISCVTLVNWCATNVSVPQVNMSCPYGSKYNDDPSYGSVFAQMVLCGWNKTRVPKPDAVDLSAAGVLGKMSTNSFAGLYNGDKKRPGSGDNYVLTFASGTVAYVVFGLLIGIVVLAAVGVAVCVCLCDNRQVNRNKSIVDRAIRAVRLNQLAALTGRDAPHQGNQPRFGYQYSMYDAVHENMPDDEGQNSPYWANSPGADGDVGMGNAKGGDFSPRDGDGREMKDMDGVQSAYRSNPWLKEQ
ncbi:hypothetical protein LSCM1_04154 [Leishmania martiniquensis]|uniref:Uncharacterized protein n=1 Tax=Leishmania martiniquensis TaxID=1580590 RepID=A0A836H7J2_9TRYP|nr:hypothetical protein LSCM1_04154 [Leishmania martiniquensis]